jgi:hypothetical protein
MPKILRSPQSETAVDAGGAITCSLHFTEIPGQGYPLLSMNIVRDPGAFPAAFTPLFPAGCMYDTWEVYDAGSAENPHRFTLAPGQDERTWPLAEITALTGWTGLDDVGSHTITTA